VFNKVAHNADGLLSVLASISVSPNKSPIKKWMMKLTTKDHKNSSARTKLKKEQMQIFFSSASIAANRMLCAFQNTVSS